MSGVYAAVLLSVLGMVYSSPFTGKCRTEGINVVTMDPKSVATTWDVVYVTETERGRDLDLAYNVITSTGDNTYKLVGTRVMKDGKTYTQEYTARLVDNIFNTQMVENGTAYEYKVHPLAKINDDAIYFYHCADNGTYPDDIRFIIIRRGKTLNEDSMNQLLEADKSHNFKGNLVKVPNRQT